MKQQRKINIPLIIAIAIAVIAGAGLWVKSISKPTEQNETKNEDIISVKTKTVQLSDIPNEMWATGTIRPIQETSLSPKIMSVISAVYVHEGDKVIKGQPIARLEAKDLSSQAESARAASLSAQSMSEKAETALNLQTAQTKANIANATAALAIAKEQLALVLEGPREQEKTQAKLAQAQAEAQYKNAETELNRARRLFDQGVIPKQKLETAQMHFDVAKAQWEIANKQVEIANEGSRQQEILSAKERVKQAEAALRLAKAASVQDEMARKEVKSAKAMANQAKASANAVQTQLGYSILTAPFSGIVAARFADPGDMASPGMPILKIMDDALYQLEAEVAISDLFAVKAGMSLQIEIGADKRKMNGIVSAVVPSADPSSRSAIVKVKIPKTATVVAGDFGRVAVPLGKSKGILLPKEIVHDNGGILNVFVVNDYHRADMRIVRTGRTMPEGIEIISGIQPGDKIITWSDKPLQDDLPVAVKGE